MQPVYLKAYNDGVLSRLIEEGFKLLENCSLCPRKCRVNRLKNQRGFCKTGFLAEVYNFMPHHGEEPPISGKSGSGTIFFSNCNMACLYCQNYEFSQLGQGKEAGCEELSDYMLQLQKMGCHNINLVTPTHVLPQILKALSIAIPHGLKIPIVYNTSGYELPEVIRLLELVVDIYLLDMRYSDDKMSIEYSSAPDYPFYNQNSAKEMYRQTGTARINEEGIMERGLIIRHLVLPNNISGTEKIMEFISRDLSQETYISLMSQYLPCYKADKVPGICRRLSCEEYDSAQETMHRYGLYNGWIQDSRGLERFAGTNIKPSF